MLMMIAVSQKPRPFRENIRGGNRSKLAVAKPEDFEGYSSVVTLFLFKKS
jgi:hypothetical protein